MRLRWVEARIAAGLGEPDEARQAFSEAQRGFLDQRISYDAALVSLEMATFLLQEGPTAEVRELAREMIPIFQAQDIHCEALAARARTITWHLLWLLWPFSNRVKAQRLSPSSMS